MSQHCIDEMKEAGVYLVATISALKNIVANADQGIPAYAVEKCERCAEAHRKSIGLFHQAGGKFAMGTDAGTPFNRHGENAQELAYLVEYGLSPSEALVAANANAADLMGIEDEGAIAEAMKADLLIVEGDPTRDIAMAADKANHRAVYKAGRLVAGGAAAQNQRQAAE